MIKQLLVVALLSISYITYGQGGFVKFLDSGPLERNEIFDIYNDEEVNRLFVLGNEIDSSNFYSLKFIKIDTLGEQEWEVDYTGEGTNDYILRNWNNIVKIDDNKYAVYGNKFKEWITFNVIFTADGQVESEFEYFQNEEDRTTITAQQIKNDDSLLTISSLQIQNGRVDYQVIKSNLSGQEIWKKKYGENNGLNDNPLFIKSLSNEEYLIVGRSITIIPSFLSDPWNSDYYIVHIDKDGNIINEIHSQTNTKDGIVSELVYFESEEGEGRLAFASTLLGVDAIANDLTSKIRYLIIDMEGNIQDSTSIGNNLTPFNYLSYNKRVEDGFLVAGQMILDDLSARWPVVGKFNENADSVWWSTYDINDTESFYDKVEITGMQILPSGSIFLCGNLEEFYDPFNAIMRPFIMKLDKDGCLEPGCRMTTSTDDLNIDRELLLTPNPTTGHVQLSADQAGVLMLYSITGTRLMSINITEGMNKIDISDLEAGIIIYNLTMGTEIQTGKLIKL